MSVPDGLRWSRALGLAVGYAADAALADPRSLHPVAGFGRVARSLEDHWYADSHMAGARHVVVLVGAAALLGSWLEGVSRSRPLVNAVLTAAATWAVLGGRSLTREAGLVHAHLMRGDLRAARERVRHLVGRNPDRLDADGVARATVESLAENTSDAVVAPLLWGALAGPTGLLGYRAANTLDAMVGHRSPRHQRFGWAAARLDDVLNLGPARVAALLAAASAPGAGGRPVDALHAWRRDAHRHPSPNAGPVEAAFAGALGLTLGGRNAYGDVVEDRGTLGSGPVATVADIPRAALLARWVSLAALTVFAGAAIAGTRRRR